VEQRKPSNKRSNIPLLKGTVACSGLVLPGATSWLYAPQPNSSIEKWRVVVIVIGYTLSVTSQYDVIFTFANQRFG